MKPHLAYPLIATAVLVACGFSVRAGTPRDCADPREAATAAAPVADDPDSPLDPRDPQFSEKQAQRYHRIGHTTPPAAGAVR
jgi:hypothetical protein